jgi:hypothetical protein
MPELDINYDTREVGVPYIRIDDIRIQYPPPGSGDMPSVRLQQQWAVKFASGQIRQFAAAPTIETSVDATSQTPIPLVDPDSGAALDAGTRAAIAGAINAGVVTMPIAMLVILAIARSLQPPAVGE